MSDTTFSLDQILESVNEMRAELRAFIDPDSETSNALSCETWQAPEDRWFEDCDFDPR